MRYVATTLNFRNHAGKWCQYQANGVGIHCEESGSKKIKTGKVDYLTITEGFLRLSIKIYVVGT